MLCSDYEMADDDEVRKSEEAMEEPDYELSKMVDESEDDTTPEQVDNMFVKLMRSFWTYNPLSFCLVLMGGGDKKCRPK